MVEGASSSAGTPWKGGYVLAVSLGFITVAVFYGVSAIVFGGVPGSVIGEAWPLLLFQILIAGAPFGVLAQRGVRDKLPWLVALVLTVCFWSALFYSGWLAARDQTGANIGMGWLMLVSPFLIAGGALIALNLARARP